MENPSLNPSLTLIQTQHIMKRFPSFELSYETISHKKVFESNNIGMAIPTGKKYFAWFTFQNNKNVCFMMELNREKRVINMYSIDISFDDSLSLGTILYGTLFANTTETKSFFIIEEIYYYKGIYLKNMTFGEKLGYIELLFTKKDIIQEFSLNNILFTLPYIWGIQTAGDSTITEEKILNEFEKIKSMIPYPVHHIQIRKLTKIQPYLNISLNTILTRMNQREKEKSTTIQNQPTFLNMNKKIPEFTINYNKLQYNFPTVFRVTPDIQYDIYHLHAFGKNKECVYYNTAYIPNIEKSIFMNNLFRNIRENKNLDYIEESDDEEDFEKIAIDKYVDLNKVYNILCVFNTKFKRWVPVRVADKNSKIVHISKLVNGYE